MQPSCHLHGAQWNFDEIILENPMTHSLNEDRLQRENVAHAGTGGISRGNAALGFRPAFLDSSTQKIYPARFADGRPAPIHLLDGLPDEVVTDRLPSGRVVAAKASLISGFEHRGLFYTRHAAARACAARAISPDAGGST
jgi:hypothetical protein